MSWCVDAICKPALRRWRPCWSSSSSAAVVLHSWRWGLRFRELEEGSQRGVNRGCEVGVGFGAFRRREALTSAKVLNEVVDTAGGSWIADCAMVRGS